MIKTIMIVEDERHFHTLYQAMLKESEYKYVHAYDGYEAMDKLDKINPDLIILDLLMNMVTGDTFFTYLKSIREYADIPVIIISSNHERLYNQLREATPELIFIEKQHLTRDRLVEEVKDLLPKPNSHPYTVPTH